MYIISKQLKNQLSEFDMEFYGLIYYCTNEKCFIDGKIGIFIVVVRILAAQYARIVKGSYDHYHCGRDWWNFIIALFNTACNVSAAVFYWLWSHKYIGKGFVVFLIMTSMTILFAFLLCFMFPYVLYDMIQPINNDLEGDWNTLICYLNCTTSARPINRTIL